MPTILITGANRGLGFEFARQYAADKWNVIACCRAPEKADKLRALAAGNPAIRIEALEVGDTKSIAALAERLKDTAIDLLLNNAGIYSGAIETTAGSQREGTDQNFGSIDSAAWLKVLKINTIAPIMLIQAFAPHLEKGGDKKIINITSKMGSLTEMGPDYVAYRSSKAALNAAMLVIMHDLKDRKVTINNLHPGWVQTDMGGAGAHLTPEHSVTALRATIARLKAGDTGQFLNYDGQIIPW